MYHKRKFRMNTGIIAASRRLTLVLTDLKNPWCVDFNVIIKVIPKLPSETGFSSVKGRITSVESTL